MRLAKRERLIAEGGERLPGVGADHAHHPRRCARSGATSRPTPPPASRSALAGRVVHSAQHRQALLRGAAGRRRHRASRRWCRSPRWARSRLERWKELVDLGDHVFVSGEVISSPPRRAQRSWSTEWQIAAKAILPLPNLHTELSDETRVRQRYLDLITREQARVTVRARAAAVASLRTTFAAHDYLEVETPMLQVIHGGASARPFSTHSNAFDTELFLRIAPELFLKRAVVGGIERVFEINRNFRNEGADSTHSPEFAMLEAYQAYGDYNQMADLTQELVQNAAMAVVGLARRHLGRRHRVRPRRRVGAAADVRVARAPPRASRSRRRRRVEDLEKLAKASGVEVELPTHGKLVEELWEHFVKGGLERPTFVMDFPVDTSPLVRDHRSLAGRRREVGPLHPRVRAGDRLLRARRPGRAARALRRAGEAGARAATTRRCASTRSSCARSSTACRRRAAWAWASTGC